MSRAAHDSKVSCPSWWTLAPTAAIDNVSLQHHFSQALPHRLKCHLLAPGRIDSTLEDDGPQTALPSSLRIRSRLPHQLQPIRLPHNLQQKDRLPPWMLPLLVTTPSMGCKSNFVLKRLLKTISPTTPL
jgi:hypothetical protein